MFWKKKITPVVETTASSMCITVKSTPEDEPKFERVYRAPLSEGRTVKVEIKRFIKSLMYSGMLYQPDGRYVFFDPERIADRIIDPVLLPQVVEAVKQIFALDTDFRSNNPRQFIDERGKTWKKID